MVKGEFPESYCPAVQPHTRCYSVSNAKSVKLDPPAEAVPAVLSGAALRAAAVRRRRRGARPRPGGEEAGVDVLLPREDDTRILVYEVYQDDAAFEREAAQKALL